MQSIKILHPYGGVGFLPWENLNQHTSFGGGLRNVRQLLDLAAQIRTFTERIEENDDLLGAIRAQVQDAETIVFLGFAFHELNMKLLSPKTPATTSRVFTTAAGISNEDVKIVISDIFNMLEKPPVFNIHVNNSLTCAALFDEWWRTLSRGL